MFILTILNILLNSVIVNIQKGEFQKVSQLCEYGKKIKIRLVEISQTQNWLIQEVEKDTGLYFDSGYLHRILTGKAKTPSIINSISKILEIQEGA